MERGKLDQFDTNGFDLGDANRTLLEQLTDKRLIHYYVLPNYCGDQLFHFCCAYQKECLKPRSRDTCKIDSLHVARGVVSRAVQYVASTMRGSPCYEASRFPGLPGLVGACGGSPRGMPG